MFCLRSTAIGGQKAVVSTALGGLRGLPLASIRQISSSAQEQPLDLQFLKFGPPKDAASTSKTVAPMVVLHGLLGSKNNNRSVCKRFAKDMNTTVYALDLRNHGDSPHAAKHDYKSLALDVEHFIDTHIQQPTIVLGHSMGAKTAMAVALRRPELVDSMISVDNSPVSARLSPEIPTYVHALKSIERMSLRSPKDAFDVLGKYEKSPDIRHFLLTNSLVKPDGTIGFRVPLDTLIKHLDHIAEFPFDYNQTRFEGPALFVRGTQSKYIPDEAIPTIGQFFPRFVLKDVDAGHWLISEKTAEFVEIVEDFLLAE
ncbi:Alpha/Beta hydrolase protein [Myxozyma melibiosi]|uniref:Alpha/Beta hydrolase protein n=1 Tax=Myxozyma melibiosi TaxID=54550 RepID=A0ABR1F7X6_9ASCO